MTPPAWADYQSAISEVVRVVWDERQALIRWLEKVEATHGDAGTVAFLERRIRLGSWYPSLIDHARRLDVSER